MKRWSSLALFSLAVQSCASHSLAPTTTTHATSEPNSAALRLAQPLDADAGVDGSDAESVEGDASDGALADHELPASSTQLELVTEAPYKPYERPIADGEVYAAGVEEQLARWNLGGNGDPSYPSNRPGFHPGTRVLVTLGHTALPAKSARSSHGKRTSTRLTSESLLAQLRKSGYWRFRLCFEQGLRQNPKLQGGLTRVRLRLLPSGRIVRARVLGTELKDKSVAECVAQRAERLAVSPGPRRRSDVTVEVELWPGDAPLPERAHPAIAAPNQPIATGRLDTPAISGRLSAEEPNIQRCFGAGVARDPALWGRLELRVDLDAAGRVARVVEHDSHFPDPEVTRCVQGVVQPLEFPAPNGGSLTFVQGFRLGRLPETSPASEPKP